MLPELPPPVQESGLPERCSAAADSADALQCSAENAAGSEGAESDAAGSSADDIQPPISFSVNLPLPSYLRRHQMPFLPYLPVHR